jgi:two-component system LytT family response regulator
MRIRTLIVDDEALARKLIRRLLANDAEIEIVGEARDGREAVASIQKLSPELVFLDVQMPEMNGFEVLEQVAPEQMPIILFVTAYDQFALKAFKAQALDYILKPFDEERLHQAVKRAKTYVSGLESGQIKERLLNLLRTLPSRTPFISRIAVKCGARVVFLKVAEIDWIEAAENYVNLHVGKQTYLLRGRLSETEKKLNPEQFFRIHRSTIVNLDRIKEFQPSFKGEGIVVLKDGQQLDASRSGSQRLQEFLKAEL